MSSSVKFEHRHRPLDREHRLALLPVQSLQIGWVTLGRRRFPAIAKSNVEAVAITAWIRGHVHL